MTIIDVLEQDQIWRTADGRPMRLVDMEASHRFNTLAMLRRRARQLQEHAIWLEARDFLRYGGPPDEFGPPEIMASAQDWLEQKPLVRRLQAMVNADGSIDGEVVPDRTAISGTGEVSS